MGAMVISLICAVVFFDLLHDNLLEVRVHPVRVLHHVVELLVDDVLDNLLGVHDGNHLVLLDHVRDPVVVVDDLVVVLVVVLDLVLVLVVVVLVSIIIITTTTMMMIATRASLSSS